MSEREEKQFLDWIRTNPHQPGGGKNCKKGTSDAESRLNSALDEVQIRFVMNLPPSVSLYIGYICVDGGGVVLTLFLCGVHLICFDCCE